ncbi:MAG: Smr/MutS family protein [Rectinemataceae bacterium]|nr:Smr/MutS family protein [Rectinemataceae bacterium]
MDFKDILARWDALEKAKLKGLAPADAAGRVTSGKKANAPSFLKSADTVDTVNSGHPGTLPGRASPDCASGRAVPEAGNESGARSVLELWLAGHRVEDKDASPVREGPPVDVRISAAAQTGADDSFPEYKVAATLTSWLASHGVVDKDSVRGEARDESREGPVSGRDMSMRPPQARLDLHGLTAAEADRALRDFLAQCSRRKLENVLIVHGKGNHSAEGPILAGVVKRVLETSPLAGSHGNAHRSLGGRGATWVRIRKSDYFSR